MSWLTLTAADLNAYMVAEQLDALRTEALAPGQADPFAEIAPDVVAKVRAYIASNPANQVDADPAKIPPELRGDVCYLILAPLLIRLGGSPTDAQQKQIEIAHTTLIALREKKLLVSQPANPIAPEVQGGSNVELASSTPRKATSRKLSCL